MHSGGFFAEVPTCCASILVIWSILLQDGQALWATIGKVSSSRWGRKLTFTQVFVISPGESAICRVGQTIVSDTAVCDPQRGQDSSIISPVQRAKNTHPVPLQKVQDAYSQNAKQGTLLFCCVLGGVSSMSEWPCRTPIGIRQRYRLLH